MAPKTFTDWKSCCKYLFELIGKNKVLAGSNTIIEDTGSGVRVHAQAGGSGSGDYTGYFEVILVPDEEINMVDVVNGADPESETAGYYQHGLNNIPVPVPDEYLVISNSGYVYVTITHDGTSYLFTFAFASSVPASTQGHIVREIAKITVTGNSMSISRSQFGNLITAGVL